MNFAAPHVGYVIAAYAIGLVVLAAMVFGTLIEYRTLKRHLERLATRPRGSEETDA